MSAGWGGFWAELLQRGSKDSSFKAGFRRRPLRVWSAPFMGGGQTNTDKQLSLSLLRGGGSMRVK